METIFETVPIGIAIAEDAACLRVRANPALERILEIAPGANASRSGPVGERLEHIRSYRDGRETQPEKMPMHVAARTGQPITGVESELRFADGRIKRVYGTASPLFDEDGNPCGSVGAFLDMTEWRRVEAALKDNEEQLRLAVQATDLGLFDRDVTTNILRWSDRGKAIFGLAPDAPITLDEFYRRLHPEDRPRVREANERALIPRGMAPTRPNIVASGRTGPCDGRPPRAEPTSKDRAAIGELSGSSAPCRISPAGRTPRCN